MPDPTGQLLEEIEHYAHDCCRENDPAHDSMHVARVVANARVILESEPAADRFVTLAAAWLHDIVQLPKGSGKPGDFARQSADQASMFLAGLGIGNDSVLRVAEAIRSHSFSGGLRPESVEAGIVQDADRLDALGAIGIARLWVTAGVLGSRLHHLADPAGTERPLDDRQFGLDHIENKLLKLPELMNTDAGRRMAGERADYVRQFRATFLAEIGGNNPD